MRHQLPARLGLALQLQCPVGHGGIPGKRMAAHLHAVGFCEGDEAVRLIVDILRRRGAQVRPFQPAFAHDEMAVFDQRLLVGSVRLERPVIDGGAKRNGRMRFGSGPFEEPAGPQCQTGGTGRRDEVSSAHSSHTFRSTRGASCAEGCASGAGLFPQS